VAKRTRDYPSMKPHTALAGAFDRRLRAFARHLPRALKGEVRSVHQARVASRRMRELLPVVAAGQPQAGRFRKLQRRVRRATRILGSVREIDVTLGVLDEVATDEVAAQGVRRHLERERTERGDRMRRKLDERGATLVGHARAVARTLDAAHPDDWREVLSARLRTRAVRLREALERAGAMYGIEALHGVRIAGKKLRYALEVTGESGAASTAQLVTTLKRGQDLLGRLHDLDVVAQHVRIIRASGAPSGAAVPPFEALEALLQRLEQDCRQLHARYLRLRASLMRVCDRVIDETVPRVRRASERRPARRRPLKMSLGAGSRAPAVRLASTRAG
jgi:CHAD domain-containing protein